MLRAKQSQTPRELLRIDLLPFRQSSHNLIDMEALGLLLFGAEDIDELDICSHNVRRLVKGLRRHILRRKLSSALPLIM